MEIKKLTDLPIGELGEENYVVADVDGAVKRISTEDIGGGGLVEGYFNGTNFYEDEDYSVLITPEKGKIYVDISTPIGKSYRWSGSQYIAIAAISSDDPHVVIYVMPGAHEVVDPAEKNSCFVTIRYPGMDPFSSQYDDDVREACAQYIFSRALGYGNSGLDSSIAILRIGDESSMEETFNVVYIYMEDGGGKYVLEMSDGAKVTIDRSNPIYVDGEYYCAWDFIPASAKQHPVVIAHLTESESGLVCDMTAAEINNVIKSGKVVILRNGYAGSAADYYYDKVLSFDDELDSVRFANMAWTFNASGGLVSVTGIDVGLDGSTTFWSGYRFDLTKVTP